MAFDVNSIVQAQTTITAAGQSGWIDTGFGTPARGMNLEVLVNGVIGDPNVLFRVSTSPDQVSIYPNTYDEDGPISVLTQRNLHFRSKYRYFRLEWLWQEQQGGGGSSNSSSLSGQSFNSSSSGGGMSLSFFAGLVAANTF